ncbi:hypothetical protein R1flu_021994 [Riccia fluitans]|uniref:Uncharacterized protein n=1 Tax=Riccia fluitans TaxID=41844 RepID=A0ABD1ZQY0_9MARC
MADQPAKALIVYGYGFMRHVGSTHSHLHELAAAGSCGFLALRSQPPEVTEEVRVVGELAQLLDLDDACQRVAEDDTNSMRIPSMSERFMNINAGIVSNCDAAAAFGEHAGFTALSMQDEETPVCSSSSLPEPSDAAARLLSYLGFHGGDDDGKPGEFELLLLHMTTEDPCGIKGGDEVVEWTDKLLGALQNLSQPGTKAGSHLYLTVVLGYGSVDSSVGDNASLSLEDVLEPKLAQLTPRQSYTVKGSQLIEGLREHHPLLVVYHLRAVTRSDEVNSFTFEEFKKHSGNLTIFVGRFLHEVAFKLWRAPKYGA